MDYYDANGRRDWPGKITFEHLNIRVMVNAIDKEEHIKTQNIQLRIVRCQPTTAIQL